MRLPSAAHTSQPWRIHALTPDFRLEDVWALPTPGGPDDFPRLVRTMASLDPGRGSAVARALFAVRWKLGELLGWDARSGGRDAPAATLSDRLPADLRGTAASAPPSALPFVPLYLSANEGALEIANRTMHGVLHLGWVADGDAGGHRGQMAILVRRNGLLGSAYMAAIAPFRHLLVYPAMLREIGRAWQEGAREPPADFIPNG